MKKNWLFKICCFIFLSLLCNSCSKQFSKKNELQNQTDNSLNKKVIGFSIDTLAIERWQRDLDVFSSRVKELGADVIVQNAGNSIEEQNRQLMYLLDRNVDVIIILPRNADAFTESIQKIRSHGIPVISYDRLVLNTDVDLYITINSEQVGTLMADGLIKRNVGNNWYCILGPSEDYNMSLISKGIKNRLAGTDIKINHTFYTDGWNYDFAYQEMVSLITKNQIPDAVICGNDAVASSVISALTNYYNGNHVYICGQDADIAACQYIAQDKQDFTIYKPITKLAEMTAEYSVALANGKKVSSFENVQKINNGFADISVIWLEPQIVDKSNMQEIIIDSGFHTYDEVFRIK